MKTNSKAKKASHRANDPVLSMLIWREMSTEDTLKLKARSSKSLRDDLTKVKLRLV